MKDVESSHDTVPQHEIAKIEYQLGRTCEMQLGRLDRALYHYQRAILGGAPNAEAVAAARSLYERIGDHDMVARLDQLHPPAGHADRASDANLTTDVEIKSASAAEDPWMSGLEERASEPSRTVNFAEDADGLVVAEAKALELKLLAALTSNAPTSETARDALAIAKLRDTVADRNAEARQRACAAYERVLELDPAVAEAAEWLSHYFYAEKDFDRLLEHTRSLKTQSEAQRAVKLCGLAQIWEHDVGDTQKTFELLSEALRLDLRNESIHDQVLSFAERSNQVEALVRLYQDLIAHATDSDVFVNLQLRVGRMLLARQPQERAADYFRAVLNVQSENEEAQRELRCLYVATEQWANLAELLEMILQTNGGEAKDSETHTDINRELVDLYEHRLQEPRRAALTLQRLLRGNDQDEGTLWRMYQLYRAAQDWEALAATGERLLDCFVDATSAHSQGVTADLRRLTLELELAQVYAESLKRPEAAIVLLESALRAHPQRRDVAGFLERLYSETNSTEQLIEHLLHQEEMPGLLGCERQQILARLGVLFEGQGARDRAIASLCRAVELDCEGFPDEAEELLCRLWVADGKIDAAVNLLQQRIDLQTRRGAAAADLARRQIRLARMVGAQNGYETIAEEALLAAAHLQPDHREPIMMLADLYRLRGHWGRFAEFQIRLARIDQSRDVHLGVEELLLGAKVLLDVEERAAAAMLYQEALTLDGRCLTAIDALIHLSAEDPVQQEHWLLRRCDLAATPRDVAQLVTELATVRRRRITNLANHAERLVALYQRAIQSDGAYVPAVRGLADLYCAVGNIDAGITTLESFIAQMQRGEAAPSKVAEVYFDLDAIC